MRSSQTSAGFESAHDGDRKVLPVGRRVATAVVKSVICVAAILSTVVVWATWKTGSIGAARAYLAGEHVYVSPSTITVSAQASDRQVVAFQNLADKPVRIVGYNASCSCVRVGGLPLIVEPHGIGRVPISGAADQSQDVPTVFITDDPNQALVPVVVKVIAPTS
jgi:hypothetical protein